MENQVKWAKVDVKSYPMYRWIPSTSLLASDLAFDSSSKASMQPEKKVLPKQSDLQKENGKVSDVKTLVDR